MKIEDFDQLNWEKEIVTNPLKTKDGQANRTSIYVKVWAMLSDILEKGFEGKEEHSRENAMRMYQYFLAKFVYNHSIFYDREMNDDEDYNPIKEMKDKYNLHDLKISKVPISKIKEIEKIFVEKVKNDNKKRKIEDGGYEEIKKFFGRRNIKVVKPKGLRKEGDRDTVAIKHDGLRYHISIMKGESKKRKEKVEEKIEEHKRNINLYHNLVKKVYLKLVERGVKDLWAMVDSGARTQMFFGDKSGYLGILYLDNRNKNRKQLSKSYRIVTQRNGMDLFDNLNIDNVSVTKAEEIWGKDED